MRYKTIAVHADTSVHAPARVLLACALARAEGAHLVGVAATGVSRFIYPASTAALARNVVSPYAASLHEHAHRALDEFEAIAAAEGVASREPRLVADDPEGALVLMSRYADLLVLSQTAPAHEVAGAVRELPEFVMLNTARPLLLAPYVDRPWSPGGKALVAWDESIEATRALGHALPLLCLAAAVTVVQFGRGAAGSLAAHATDLVAWLGRHGVRANVLEERLDIGDGNALLSLAADQQAGLLVMGGYGHARFRELLLGGVTRTVLDAMTVPVLMAH
ncbi:universal stress protein [Massilia solisilvae]|uniref:Universal stress protein n=1 Tax=Massilia solisilvae TaxID=1811225 RepID=A0ABT2BI28_9BURK|nr:universal stress protein [Massilia solisilvae]MCS0608105.1 universal stress protein [Massilia solisilvae]